jgi:hypothetical protein
MSPITYCDLLLLNGSITLAPVNVFKHDYRKAPG